MPNSAMNCPAEPDDLSAVTATEPGGDPDGRTALGQPPSTSTDAFWRGRFHLVQPKGRGFRAGLDALLLASSLPLARCGLAVDLGAGAGAAGLAAAVRCPGLTVQMVENDPVMAEMARRSLALPQNADLAPRISLTEADVLSPRAAREADGLFDGRASLVLTNPPFHPAGARGSPDALRRAARTLADIDMLPRWIATAAALLEPSGLFALVARPENLPDILQAFHNRLGDARILAVHPRADRPAIRILVHARKGSRAGLSLRPPLVLHHEDGTLTSLGCAVGDGDAMIDLGL